MDENYDFGQKMRYCIDLALRLTPRGIGKPWVGAVVLDSSGEIIGEGVRAFLSGTRLIVHAEREAIDKAISRVNGSKDLTLITTLQPCGKIKGHQLFKSCSELIVDAGIKRVVLGLFDDSPSFDSTNARGYLTNRGVNVIHYKKMEAEIRENLMSYFQHQ